MSNLPEILGVCGYSSAGKSTLASGLAERHGYTVLSPVSLIRRSLYALNPIVGTDDHGNLSRIRNLVLDPYENIWWEQLKTNPRYSIEVLALLQRLGDEATRGTVGEDIWISAVIAEAHRVVAAGGRVIIDSIRFDTDANTLLADGGVLLRVERPGLGPINTHPAETGMDGYPAHFTIVNDATPDDMVDATVDALDGWITSHLRLAA